uniref:Uncharacterized protein n=1 Tax=Anguilla anguilla TaxID=7936 RepID=A0A0E9RP71_ANGAN
MWRDIPDKIKLPQLTIVYHVDANLKLIVLYTK